MPSALCQSGGLLKQTIDCLNGKNGEEWLEILQYALRRQIHPSLQQFTVTWPTINFEPTDNEVGWERYLLMPSVHFACADVIRSDSTQALMRKYTGQRMSYGYLDLSRDSSACTIGSSLPNTHDRFAVDTIGLYLFARLMESKALDTSLTYCFVGKKSLVLVRDKEGQFWRILEEKPGFDWILPAGSRVFFSER